MKQQSIMEKHKSESLALERQIANAKAKKKILQVELTEGSPIATKSAEELDISETLSENISIETNTASNLHSYKRTTCQNELQDITARFYNAKAEPRPPMLTTDNANIYDTLQDPGYTVRPQV